MTEETQKLFDAPWTARGCPHVYAVNDARGELKAETFSAVGANRLARLPELYDALMEQLKSYCWVHCKEDAEKILHDGCPHVGGCVTCLCTKHFELLKKVRDGE